MAETSFWKDKKVCITGGSSGIGLEMVKILLSKGAVVYNMSRRIPPVSNKNLITLQADLYKNIPELNVDLDVAIMNIGVNIGSRSFDNMSEEEIDRSIYLNLNIHVVLARRLRYKKIVFINSVLSLTGLPNNIIYCGSKSFISSFNDSLRREGKDTYIVYPYKVNTELFNEIKDFLTVDKNYLASIIISDIEHGVKKRTVPFYFYLIVFMEIFLPTLIGDFIAKKAIQIFTKSKINKKD